MEHRDVVVRPLAPTDAEACLAIGRALPAWFGIEEGLEDMVSSARNEPGWVAVTDERVIGFVTLRRHFPEAWEISWMAIDPEWHRQGIGRMLVKAVVEDARRQGVTMLQVKTLAATHPSPEYAATRAFYASVGFAPLEVFPELWGSANPALQVVMWLGNDEQ